MKKKFWIVNKKENNKAEVLLYGYISQYDISSADFIVELTLLANTYDEVLIRINSGGGSVFEGIAIYNAIRQLIKSGKKINTQTDGIAASMAAVIAISGITNTISQYGRIMTHRACGYAQGDADDIRQQADLVESAENDIVKILAQRTGLSEADARTKFLQKGVDNWMNAAKCVEYKLSDSTYDSDPVPVPENVTDEKEVYNIFESCLNQSSSKTNKYKMDKELLKKLGLDENATDTQIDAAVGKVITEKTLAETTVQNAARTNAETLVDTVGKGRLTADKREQTVKMAMNDYEGTKAMLEMIPIIKKPTDIINKTTPAIPGEGSEEVVASVTATKGEGWDTLRAQGADAVEACRKDNFDLYAKLYQDKYDRKPQQMGVIKR